MDSSSSSSRSSETKLQVNFNPQLFPEATATWFSRLTFQWITPLLSLGYKRPLEAKDLYRLQDGRASAVVAAKILESYTKRTQKADVYNARIASGDVRPSFLRRFLWMMRGSTYMKDRETTWRMNGEGKRRPSLAMAMSDSVAWWFWSGGIIKLIGELSLVTSPLLVREIINFGKQSYSVHRSGQGEMPHIGIGIGYAIGLFLMQVTAAVCINQFFYRGQSTGVLLRGGLIAAIYDRSLNLTGRAKARSGLNNGVLMSHISVDVSRIDFCCGFFHASWTGIIQLVVCLVLLILNLGAAATFAGFSIFLIATPLQTLIVKKSFGIRGKSMKWTDQRVRMLQEVLSGLRIVKSFAWEDSWIKRIAEARQNELRFIRSLLLIRAGNNAVAASLPVLASDLAAATQRLSKIFDAELRKKHLDSDSSEKGKDEDAGAEGGIIIDKSLDVALQVSDAEWTWEESSVNSDPKSAKTPPSQPNKPVATESQKDQPPFHVKNIDLVVPRGQLVAIVGAVGSGKTSLMQGCLGEMRRLSGTVRWGGSVGLCSQIGWVQNATIRENICFGRPFDEARYQAAIRDSCLEQDLKILTDQAEVGEKGITLSGGQKQRLNIARALYCDADIQIFDDPFSALDAHVGKSVFENAILKSQAGKTRIVITHALHFLPRVDYIYTIVDGVIQEQGTYQDLMAHGGDFARVTAGFTSSTVAPELDDRIEPITVTETNADMNNQKKLQMHAEERGIGAIPWHIYSSYLLAGNGFFVIPLIILSLVLVQASMILSAFWLVWWQEIHFGRSNTFYIGVYAGLGISQAITFFLLASNFASLTYFASKNLHMQAVRRIIHVPLSWMERQPLGRVMYTFSKDVDTIDNNLVSASLTQSKSESLRMFSATMANIIGAIILISIIVPWFLIGIFGILVIYGYIAHFYRASARDLKRIDALLRSDLYSHFSESLTGLSTIRAYGEEERFKERNKYLMDLENRAYMSTVANQRWLGIRLDFLGTTLTLIVGLLTVTTRALSPSQTGVALSYIMSIQQAFGWLVRQTAEVENDMTSVERLVHYSQEIDQEGTYTKPEPDLPKQWPSKGQLTLKNVVLRYREDLPTVLKGISMDIMPGEKIGIVGRTGAGKSSIMTALYRIVELEEGSISIDGVDISTLGLKRLRQALAIIPQDAPLFSGTVRSNLDPFNIHDDATLWDALRRAYLVETTKTESDEARNEKFHLDFPIEDEGSNLSIGQRSLLSLARALVTESKILILDEATASVDYETDRKIQDTIADEFHDRTILCIAHRLRTIISYDRIVCLDAGTIAEFDTPSNLYQKEGGIFRTMCERSSITFKDIQQARRLSL
ncbi:P-loop containing nucleoside triphosphate hydrolase protein [Flagelloscypha sp. PMI_526]|nr:P-loop containing nucleoside triphosphate hydrolase protein [Flagelloscypha sp. PMI_526]